MGNKVSCRIFGHFRPAAAYMAEAGYAQSEVDFCAAAAPALRASELMSAASTSRFLSDVVVQQRRRARSR